jgi:short-subunit dehydrogenase involved in D-alanine esterification of teichoic acids
MYQSLRRCFTFLLFSDLLDTDNYDKIIDVVSEKTKTNGLNVLLNNAAVSNRFTRIGLVKKDKLVESFLVNTVAPIMLTKVLLLSFYAQLIMEMLDLN